MAARANDVCFGALTLLAFLIGTSAIQEHIYGEIGDDLHTSDVEKTRNLDLSHMGVRKRRADSNSTQPPYVTVRSHEWRLHGYPNPQVEPKRCGRKEGFKSFVCDPANIITFRQANKLDSIMESAYTNSPCVCEPCPAGGHSYQMAVALVPKIFMSGAAGEDELQREIKSWAAQLRSDAWNYGKCEDSVVILVSRDDDAVYTSVGQAAQKVLTKECMALVDKQAHTAYFRDGEYSKGLIFMLYRYRDIVKGDVDCSGASTRGLSEGAILIIVLGCLLVLPAIGFVIYCIFCRGYCRSCRRDAQII